MPNREQHTSVSLIFLVIILSVWLAAIYYEQNAIQIFLALVLSIILYIWGSILPDIDHAKVQRKYHVRIFGRILRVKHRGRIHSIGACLIYMGIIGGVLYLLSLYIHYLEFWYYPTIFGGLGYFSHLALDDLNSFIHVLRGEKPGRKALKLWGGHVLEDTVKEMKEKLEGLKKEE